MVSDRTDGKARADQLHQRMVDEVRKLRSGQTWKAWMDAAMLFHDYSFRNIVLITMQRPDATRVAGYRTWQRLGRQVNKNESGIQILAPMRRKATKDELDDSSTEKVPADRPIGFRVAWVFDISQTSGDPLPAPPGPGRIVGQAPHGLWDALAAEVVRAGFTLARETIPEPGVKGFTSYMDRRVVVAAELHDVAAVATLAHEVAHMTMHMPDPQEGSGIEKCQGVREVEAESVAYILLSHHGLHSDEASFAYVTGWAASLSGTEPDLEVQKVGTYVVGVARRLIDSTSTYMGARAPQPARPTRHTLLAPSTPPDDVPDIAIEPR